MLGRNSFTPDEIGAARASVTDQLAAFRSGAGAGAGAGADAEATYFNGMLLALDRRFVHRVRKMSGNGCTPLNELEVLADSLMNNAGVLQTSTVIKYTPDRSVLGLASGDTIRLGSADFERLATAVLDEIETASG